MRVDPLRDIIFGRLNINLFLRSAASQLLTAVWSFPYYFKRVIKERNDCWKNRRIKLDFGGFKSWKSSFWGIQLKKTDIAGRKLFPSYFKLRTHIRKARSLTSSSLNRMKKDEVSYGDQMIYLSFCALKDLQKVMRVIGCDRCDV